MKTILFSTTFVFTLCFSGLLSQAQASETTDLLFSGAFETQAVEFKGASHKDIFEACAAYIKENPQSANDLYVFGQYNSLTWYLKNEELCAYAVLNAKSANEDTSLLNLKGSMEFMWFSIVARDQKEMRDVIYTYVPKIDQMVKDLGVNHGGKGSPELWTTQEVATILAFHAPDPSAQFKTDGVIKFSPFALYGKTREDIEAECSKFYDAVFGPHLVNSASFFDKGSSYPSTIYFNGIYFGKETACKEAGNHAVDLAPVAE